MHGGPGFLIATPTLLFPLFTQLPRRVLLGNSEMLGHKKGRGSYAPAEQQADKKLGSY